MTAAQQARRVRVRATFTDAFGKTEVRHRCISDASAECKGTLGRVADVLSIEREGDGVVDRVSRTHATPHATGNFIV